MRGCVPPRCQGILKVSTRGAVYVEETTSKPRIVIADVEAAWKAACTAGEEFVRVGVFCGRWSDRIGLVAAKMKALARARERFVVTCTFGGRAELEPEARVDGWIDMIDG